MSRKIHQFYYKDALHQNIITSGNTETSDTAFGKLTSGDAFTNYLPIVQLGIQALPGTEFILNNNGYTIMIGSTGIYELDLDTSTTIKSIRIKEDSLTRIKESNGSSLIIDVVYEEE